MLYCKWLTGWDLYDNGVGDGHDDDGDDDVVWDEVDTVTLGTLSCFLHVKINWPFGPALEHISLLYYLSNFELTHTKLTGTTITSIVPTFYISALLPASPSPLPRQ